MGAEQGEKELGDQVRDGRVVEETAALRSGRRTGGKRSRANGTGTGRGSWALGKANDESGGLRHGVPRGASCHAR